MGERRSLLRARSGLAKASPCVLVQRGEEGYPGDVARRLGGAAPDRLLLFGNRDLTAAPAMAILASIRTPAGLVLRGLDAARVLRTARLNVIGGFQSPLEREMLRLLLRGQGSVVVCSARRVEGMRIPGGWRPALDAGRLLLVGEATYRWRRATVRSAMHRNRLVTALAESLFVVHAHAGSRTYRSVAEAIEWGRRVYCFDHPANRDLVLLGAEPVSDVAALSHGLERNEMGGKST